MNRLILILSLFTLLFVGCGENGTKTEYYENGQKKIEGNYNFGKKDGLWTEYYENGSIKKTTWLSKGRSFGEEVYYENVNYGKSNLDKGKMKSESIYVSYAKGFEYIEYFENEKIKIRGRYNENGLKDEGWHYEELDGSSNFEYYKDGDPAAEWYWLDTSGDLIKKEDYRSKTRQDYDEREERRIQEKLAGGGCSSSDAQNFLKKRISSTIGSVNSFTGIKRDGNRFQITASVMSSQYGRFVIVVGLVGCNSGSYNLINTEVIL